MVISIHGQSENAIKKLYVEGGTGFSSHNGIMYSFALRSVWKNNWTASFSYYGLEMDSKNMPGDYEQGYTLILLFPIPDEMPYINMSMVNFTGGKLFEISKKLWVTTEAGLSVVKGDKLSFTSQPVVNDGFHISSNYSTRKETQSTIGGMVRVDISWSFIRWLGLSAGFFAGMNSIQSPVGGELKLIAGLLRRKA